MKTIVREYGNKLPELLEEAERLGFLEDKPYCTGIKCGKGPIEKGWYLVCLKTRSIKEADLILKDMDNKDLGRSVKEVEQTEAGISRGQVFERVGPPDIALVLWIFPRRIPECSEDKYLGKNIAELRENIRYGNMPLVLYRLNSNIVKPE